MTEQHQSSQLLLEPEQYETLSRMAREQGRTITDVTQEVVRLGLEALQIQKASRMAALKRLNQRRQEDYQSHGVYPGDIVAEVRAEREKHIERMLRGEP